MLTIDEVITAFPQTDPADWKKRKTAWVHRTAKIGERVKLGSAVIGPKTAIGEGTTLIGPVTIGTGTRVGILCIINTASIGDWIKIGNWVTVEQGVLIDNHTAIGNGATLAAWTRVGSNVLVGGWSKVGRGVVLSNGNRIGTWTTINAKALIRTGAVLGNDVNIGGNAVIGYNVTIGNNSDVGDGVKIKRNLPHILIDDVVVNIVSPGCIRMGSYGYPLVRLESDLDAIASELRMSQQDCDELRDWLVFARAWMTRNDFLEIATTEQYVDTELVFGYQIQHDPSGVGHAWANINAFDIGDDVVSEIHGKIIDGGCKTHAGFTASNGLNYRW